MEATLEKVGFGWLLQGRIDWLRNCFSPTIAEKFIFNDWDLLQSYKARWGRVYTVQDTYLEIDHLGRLLGQCFSERCELGISHITKYFYDVCIRAY